MQGEPVFAFYFHFICVAFLSGAGIGDDGRWMCAD